MRALSKALSSDPWVNRRIRQAQFWILDSEGDPIRVEGVRDAEYPDHWRIGDRLVHEDRLYRDPDAARLAPPF